jgi:hypothetical protein
MLVASLIGVLAGLTYSVSPLTALFALLLPVLFWWTARGLEAWERRWAFSLLAAATVLRVVAIAVLLLTTTPAQHFKTYFPDAQFAITRSWWVRNIWLGVPIGPANQIFLNDSYGATSYSYVLGAIQVLVGQAPYGLNFVSTTAFLVGVIALYRVARQSFGPYAAAIGLAVLLFWPTTFAWSVSMLKESMQFALTALLVAFTLRGVRSRTRWARVNGVLLAVATAYALATLQSAAVYVAVAGCVSGVVAWGLTRRPWRIAVSAVALLALTVAALSRPALREQAMDVVRSAAMRQIGHVTSYGLGYKVLDQRFYSYGSKVVRTLEPEEAVRFLSRAVWAFFTAPLPWEIESRASLAYLPQQVVWYVLVLLGIPGAVAGFRRDPLVTWILVGIVAAGVAVTAPNSGNFGTLIRHRDMVSPVLALLGVAGFASVLGFLVRPNPKLESEI